MALVVTTIVLYNKDSRKGVFMSMLCIKTGCHLWSSDEKVFYHGDLYAEVDDQMRTNENEVWVLKYTWRGYAAGRDFINCEIEQPLFVGEFNVGTAHGVLLFKNPEFFDYQGRRLEDVLEG